jgi:hypothetical protein
MNGDTEHGAWYIRLAKTDIRKSWDEHELERYNQKW